MTKHKTLYLSQQNLARVTAEAWLDDDFRRRLEIDPIPTIKKRFVYTNPPKIDDFDLIGIIAPRPDGITDNELWRIVNGDIVALPDRYMPPNVDPPPPTNTEAVESPTENPVYLSQEEWCRITALAWVDEEFKFALLRDPGDAIRKQPEFNGYHFDRVLWVPPRPDYISEDQAKEIASGYQEAIVIPFFTFSDA